MGENCSNILKKNSVFLTPFIEKSFKISFSLFILMHTIQTLSYVRKNTKIMIHLMSLLPTNHSYTNLV